MIKHLGAICRSDWSQFYVLWGPVTGIFGSGWDFCCTQWCPKFAPAWAKGRGRTVRKPAALKKLPKYIPLKWLFNKPASNKRQGIEMESYRLWLSAVNLWALQNWEEPVSQYPSFLRRKHTPVSSGCTKLWLQTDGLSCVSESHSATEEPTAGNDRLGCPRSQLQIPSPG